MWHIRDDLVTIYRLINTVWTDKWHFLVYDNLAIARHRKKKKKEEKKESQVRSGMPAAVIAGWRRLIEIFSKISCVFSK